MRRRLMRAGFSPSEFSTPVTPGQSYLVLVDRYAGGASPEDIPASSPGGMTLLLAFLALGVVRRFKEPPPECGERVPHG